MQDRPEPSSADVLDEWSGIGKFVLVFSTAPQRPFHWSSISELSMSSTMSASSAFAVKVGSPIAPK